MTTLVHRTLGIVSPITGVGTAGGEDRKKKKKEVLIFRLQLVSLVPLGRARLHCCRSLRLFIPLAAGSADSKSRRNRGDLKSSIGPRSRELVAANFYQRLKREIN